MQKKVIEISCYVAGAGAFGVFLRWMQDQLAFDDAGLPEQSVFHVLLPVYLAVVAYVFFRFVRGYGKAGFALPEDYAAAFANDGRWYALARWVIGAAMMLGGLVTLMTTELDKYAGMLRILAILAILTGVAFPLLMDLVNREGVKPSLLCTLSLAPLLLFAFWLVCCYRRNSINGVAWTYLVEVVTVCMALLAFFRVAGFPFGAPSWRRCMFDVCFAAMLCLTSLADERYMGLHLIFFATALMLLYLNWIMVCNLRPVGEAQPSAESKEEDGGFERL